MISHVYLCAVLMLSLLPAVWCQCTTSRCQDEAYEPPRWENGAVYLESLLTETSERIIGTVDSRLTELTSNMESRLAEQSATMESRLEALEERQVVENHNLATNSESRLNLTIGAMMDNMEETMVVERRNLVINFESWLNLTIGAMMNNMEERIRHEIRTVANTTEIQLKEVQTQSNVTVEEIHSEESSSKAQLQILRLLASRVQVTFLRRVNGSVNFTRNWADYKSGFGNNNEFWLGLEKLHQLTTQHKYGLRVDMEDFSGERKWASYQSFSVGSESGNYTLTVTGYNMTSTAGDGMADHNGMKFSTHDKDNDLYGGNCADNGGWWYNDCACANPTGLYKPAGYTVWDGITWHQAYATWRSFKSMSLKLIWN